MKMLWVIMSFTVLVAAGGSATVIIWRQPETTAAIRGQIIARNLGCFGCHGPEGLGGVTDPSAPAGKIPDWNAATAEMYAQTEQDIREWILYGAPRAHASANGRVETDYLIPMIASHPFQNVIVVPPDTDHANLHCTLLSLTGHYCRFAERVQL